jgi:hypothetical protein
LPGQTVRCERVAAWDQPVLPIAKREEQPTPSRFG